jgi:CMP/dCMP kinase
MPEQKFLITISRQLGSGGAYVGQELAKRLNILYADREIIHEAAKQLSVLDKDIKPFDEKTLSFWQFFLQNSGTVSSVYIPPKIIVPIDRELFETESEIIKHIAKEHSAVIVGRCGFHILREYQDHIRIFLYGDIAFRNERIQKLYKVSKETAGKMIAKSDKERELYCKTFTGKEWTDARNYDLSMNTSKMDIDKTIKLIIDSLNILE